MPQVKILPAPKRTCEQSLAFRAQVSPPHLTRQLPRPALPPTVPLAPAEQLRRLLAQLDSPRPVYRRLGEQALESGNDERLAYAIGVVQTEIDYCRTEGQKLAGTYPLLYAKPA